MTILVTTSRHPNPRLRTFVKDLVCALPNAFHINRGKLNIDELAAEAYRRGSDVVIIVCRGLYGNPGRIVFMHIYEDRFEFYPLIIQIRGVKLIREMPDAKPRKVTDEIIGYFPNDEVEEFALALGEALRIPVLKLYSIDDLRGIPSATLLINRGSRREVAFIVKFISSRDLMPIGPIIRIRKVVYKCPSIA